MTLQSHHLQKQGYGTDPWTFSRSDLLPLDLIKLLSNTSIHYTTYRSI